MAIIICLTYENAMKMKNLSYLLVVLSLLFVGCNNDDNDDDANLPEVGKAFAATTEHWYMDLDGFEGAFKTAYDEMKAKLETKDAMPGKKGWVMQKMFLTKDTISYSYLNEGYKEMGAPEDMYTENGYLLITIETVAGMKNQVVFKGIKMDPAVELTEHVAIGWYGREGFTIPQFKAFIDMLATQAYMIEADNAAAPKRLTFKGVNDSSCVFKLRLMEK